MSPRTRRLENLYSLSGVVHGLNGSFRIYSPVRTVNNAVAMADPNFLFPGKEAPLPFRVGLRYEQETCSFDEHGAIFDRSRNPNADTHPQVLTSTVSLYTVCAPRSHLV
jgi:hypothetical protein